jgi:hypothetical protein
MALIFAALRPMGTCSTWTDVLSQATGKSIAADVLAKSHVLVRKTADQAWEIDVAPDLGGATQHRGDANTLLIVNLSLPLDRAGLGALAHSPLAERVLVHEADWSLWRSSAATVLTDAQPRKYSTGTKEHYEEWRWILDHLQVRDDREFNEATHNFNRGLDSLRLLLYESPARSAVEAAFASNGGFSGFQDKLASAFETLGEKAAYLAAADADALRQNSFAVVEAVQTALDVDNAPDWNVNSDALIRAIDAWYSLLKNVRNRPL